MTNPKTVQIPLQIAYEIECGDCGHHAWLMAMTVEGKLATKCDSCGSVTLFEEASKRLMQ